MVEIPVAKTNMADDKWRFLDVALYCTQASSHINSHLVKLRSIFFTLRCSPSCRRTKWTPLISLSGKTNSGSLGLSEKNPAGGLWWPFGKRSKAGHEGDAPTKIEVVMPRLCLRRNMFVALKRVKQSIAGAPKGAF